MNIHLTKIDRVQSIAISSIGTVVLVVIGAFVFAFMRISALTEEVGMLQSQLASTTSAFSVDLSILHGQVKEHTDSLIVMGADLRSTTQNVVTVQSQLGGVTQTVGQISGTVTTLEKLSKTDPELLQKYSKVFFLNEHYAPERVVEIGKGFLYNEEKPELIHAGAWQYLQNLLVTAKNQGVTIYVKSGYRSFDEQKGLKSIYAVSYGTGTANQFSADQGYSEHQLGTTVDFITTGLGGQLDGFETTQAYQWLLGNAHRFGFTLSYPKGNAYYMFEPWHWRFVGVALATDLHSSGRHFYDLDQREIDKYLTNIFD